MNYSTIFKNLRTEIASFCQYKRLSSPFNAFAIIATVPFWLLTIAFICLKYVYLFCFNGFASAADYLESWVKKTKQGVNTWTTEAVIYFVTMPMIFFFRIMLSIFGVVFYFAWFCTMCVTYIATLGGIKWQPFISEATFGEKVFNVKTNAIAANTIILIGFILFCLAAILSFFNNNYEVVRVANVFRMLYAAFMVIAIPITFRYKLTDKNAAAEGNTKDKEKEDKVVQPAKTEKSVKNDIEDEFPEF